MEALLYILVVQEAWNIYTHGNPMYSLQKKLKNTKEALKIWSKKIYGSGNKLSTDISIKLEQVQLLNFQPAADQNSYMLEKLLVEQLESALQSEASMVQQKIKQDWSKLGNRNTKFFHTSLKIKQSRAFIHSITDTNGLLHVTPSNIDEAFLSYYNKLLGNQHVAPDLSFSSNLHPQTISHDTHQFLISSVTDDEIKNSIFSMRRSASPGPDGFTVSFYTHCWNIVSKDVLKDVHNFFDKNKMLSSINSTNLALIPKIPNPCCVSDFRPIACCNVIYKAISRILAQRLKVALIPLISSNQAAFLPNRKIIDNILLTHELVNGYSRKFKSACAMLKIDIRKAFDMVNWSTILHIMAKMNFPPAFTRWIELCISTVRYSLIINAHTVGYFRGFNGLRQGDPISPYLFILVMEFLTLEIERQVMLKNFILHPMCRNPMITSLAFADDLMIFTKPTEKSLKTIMDTLDAFHRFSGLRLNKEKSNILIAGVSSVHLALCLNITRMSLLDSSMSYLGVPLATKRITVSQCIPLYEKITAVLSRWENRYLTHAGRLVILDSIIFSMSIYWCRSFLMPMKLIAMIHTAKRKFLWSGSIHTNKLSPIAYNKLERPKDKGGLGLKNMKIWNFAALSIHFERLVMNEPSLWVDWCVKHNLKTEDIWTAKSKPACSWVWNTMLKVRDKVLPISCLTISANSKVKFWHAPWIQAGTVLSKLLTYDEIMSSNIPLNARAASYIVDGKIRVPRCGVTTVDDVLINYDGISYSLASPMKYGWTASLSAHSTGLVAAGLSSVDSQHKFKWSKRIWNCYLSERLNFFAWRVLLDALHTRSKLRSKGLDVPLYCEFCRSYAEDVHHLFFQCNHSFLLWNKIKRRGGYGNANRSNGDEWFSIYKATRWKLSSTFELLIMLKVTLSTVWQERNGRIFNGNASSSQQLFNSTCMIIRKELSLSSFPFDHNVICKWC